MKCAIHQHNHRHHIAPAYITTIDKYNAHHLFRCVSTHEANISILATHKLRSSRRREKCMRCNLRVPIERILFTISLALFRQVESFRCPEYLCKFSLSRIFEFLLEFIIICSGSFDSPRLNISVMCSLKSANIGFLLI